MLLEQFFTEGLGCMSYLVGCSTQRVAAVIDPDRQVDKYLAAAQRHGLRITHIIETHLHADHVSGNTALAEKTGAAIFLHALAGARYPHQVIQDNQRITLGELSLLALHTPGHTPESLTLVVSDASQPGQAPLAFTGDTLMIGDCGRPDLVGGSLTAGELAKQMYSSLQRYLSLPEDLIVYPGHGAGSLCARSLSDARQSTLGQELRSNPALAVRSQEQFIQYATQNLPDPPANHQRIKTANRLGPVPLGEIAPQPLTIREAIPYFQRGAGMLDTRPKAEYVLKHVPGSVHIEWSPQLVNRVGTLLPPDLPLILLLGAGQSYAELVTALSRIGFEKIVGYLSESLERWEALGLPTAAGDIQDMDVSELESRLKTGELALVDVREPWEFRQAHVRGAMLIPLSELERRKGELDPEKPLAVICASGNRSQTGAAILGRAGFKTLYNVVGGIKEWIHHGFPFERA